MVGDISQLQKSKSLVTLKDTNMFKKASKFSKPIAKIKGGRLLIIKNVVKNGARFKLMNTLVYRE